MLVYTQHVSYNASLYFNFWYQYDCHQEESMNISKFFLVLKHSNKCQSPTLRKIMILINAHTIIRIFIVCFIYKPPGYFLSSFESMGLLVQEKFKIDFQDGRISWISNQNDFSYFWSTCHPDTSYKVSSQLPFWFRRCSKQIFKMDARFPIWTIFAGRSTRQIFKMAAIVAILDQTGTILAIFDLQVAQILTTKFQVSWSRGVGGVVI